MTPGTPGNKSLERDGPGDGLLGQMPRFESVERRLLTHLGHQLRTPINHIVGYGELLQEEVTERGQIDLLPDLLKIGVAAAHLLPLIDAILHPSTIEADAVGAEVRDRDLRTGLNAIIGYAGLVSEQLAERGQIDLLPDLLKIGVAAAELLPLASAIRDLAKSAYDTQSGQTEILEAIAMRRVGRPPKRSTTKPAASGVGGESLSVLIVDDEEASRELLSRRTARLGYAVTVVHSGRRALDALTTDVFDLVLLDLIMPGMDGFQVLARLKSEPAWRRIPVIIMSTLDEVASIVTCIQLGAADYLTKPCESSLLNERIWSALEKGQRNDKALAADCGLTPREIEVLRLVAAGNKDRQIAQILFISHATARTHVTNVLAKLGVNTRAAATALAHERDFV